MGLYLRVLVETGLVGFFGIIWIFISVYRELDNKIKAVGERSIEKTLLLGFLGGFIAHSVHFCATATVQPLPWNYFWFALALAKNIGR